MAIKSIGKGEMRVGTCVVENRAELWKAHGEGEERERGSG